MARWITQAEYARQYNVTESAVSQAVKAGRLTKRNGKVDSHIRIGDDNADPEIRQIRIEKMRIETELKRTQLQDVRFQLMREGADGFCKEIDWLLTNLQTELRTLYIPKAITDQINAVYQRFLGQLRQKREEEFAKLGDVGNGLPKPEAISKT